MLCLVDNLRTDSHNLLNLVRFYSGDIRRCILTLQVWAESGGDLTSELRPLPTGVDTGKQDSLVVCWGIHSVDTGKQDAMLVGSVLGDSQRGHR